MWIFSRNISRLKFFLVSFEFLLIFGCVYGVCLATFLLHHRGEGLWLLSTNRTFWKVLIVVVVCQISMYGNELYDYKIAQGRREFTIRLLQSMGIGCIVLSILYLFFSSASIGQTNFLLALPTVILAVLVWRQVYPRIIRSEAFAERVLLLGSKETGQKILEEIEAIRDSGYRVVAMAVERPPLEGQAPHRLPVEHVLALQEFPDKMKSIPVDRIVVAIGDRRGKLPFEALLDCRFQGIQVEEDASFYESLTGKILLDNVRPSWFIFTEGFHKSKLTLQLKRTSDILMAAAILLVTSPLMLLIALLIKLDSKGPVIYQQDRVGEGWKDYTIYKFRSMIENAEARGAVWAEQDDPRVTRVGRFIRKYRIDELPQLLNVLKGDMSIVGPRPERRCFIQDLAREIPYYPQRLFVKPGVTGWAQIKFHYGASRDDTKEKLQYDLYYIKHMSFLFDLSIIFDTVKVVLTGKGAR
ncbi:MAG: TIGR03013 family XrtA/PEP-CTERM system glycosyltransferase [bacterium]